MSKCSTPEPGSDAGDGRDVEGRGAGDGMKGPDAVNPLCAARKDVIFRHFRADHKILV